jgi:hypothetical protein
LVVNNISFCKLFSKERKIKKRKRKKIRKKKQIKKKKRKRIKEGIKEKWIRPHAIIMT